MPWYNGYAHDFVCSDTGNNYLQSLLAVLTQQGVALHSILSVALSALTKARTHANPATEQGVSSMSISFVTLPALTKARAHANRSGCLARISVCSLVCTFGANEKSMNDHAAHFVLLHVCDLMKRPMS